MIRIKKVELSLAERVKSHIDAITTAVKQAIKPDRITVEYPRERRRYPDVFRGFIVFDKDKCISCFRCAQICPANAIKTGLMVAGAEFILVSMADGSDDYSSVKQMLELARQGVHIVCGSRYIKGGKMLNAPKFKQFLSKLAGYSLHILTGIPTHDITNSFKLYSKSIFSNITISL